MDCKEFKNIVADLFDKDVSPETRKACNEHISHCAECRNYYESLMATAVLLRPKHSPISQKPIASNSNWMKIAASFIGVLLVSGIAFAAIRIVRQYQKQESPQTEITENVTNPATTAPADTLTSDTITVQPIIYDNIPLEKMLPEIAAHYDVKVIFTNDEARQLRFRFVWNPQQGINQVISDLNQFERLTVTRKDNQITVDWSLSPSEK